MDVSNQLPEIMYSPKPLLAVLKVVWASEATFPVGSLKRNWGSSPPPVEELKTPSSREKRPLHACAAKQNDSPAMALFPTSNHRSTRAGTHPKADRIQRTANEQSSLSTMTSMSGFTSSMSWKGLRLQDCFAMIACPNPRGWTCAVPGLVPFWTSECFFSPLKVMNMEPARKLNQNGNLSTKD